MPLDLDPYRQACRHLADALTSPEQRDKLADYLLTMQRVANVGSREEMQTAVAYGFACVDFANKAAS